MEENKSEMVRNIMHIVEEIYQAIGPAVPEEWLSSDITVTQLRLLLILQASGPIRMSDIASRLKVTLPTATIVVDGLVRRSLVQRESNPQDRRVVICKLSPEGQTLIKKLWGSGQAVIEKLLEGLTSEELQITTEVAELLYHNALKFNDAKSNFTS
jgi:DNA-binding MarR family transcriptional regulator